MNNPQISLREKVEREVLNEVIGGLNSGSIPLEKAREIARETLVAIKKIGEHEESVLNFYQKLSKMHPAFNVLYSRVKGEIIMNREVSEYRKALLAIDQGKINEANKIVNSALGKTANETVNVK